jgi:L-ascorbate metabolism protein UlaG (beta-lactamase superfamily)
MDIQYYGANCLVFTNKNFRLVIDDNLSELGLKPIIKKDDIVVFTGSHKELNVEPKLLIDQPGEYEVSGLSITGIAARSHMDEPDAHSVTMYKIVFAETSYLITDHIYPDLDDDQLETIGTVDVMFVPVGGNGYTLDATGALQLIKKIEPKLVIPTHYAEDDIHYPVVQQSLEQALKNLGMEPKETITKLHLKPGEPINETVQLVVLDRN